MSLPDRLPTGAGGRRTAVAPLAALGLLTLLACDVPSEPTGGAPGEPLAGLSPAASAGFERGRALFDAEFTDAQGLGPTFNQRRCSSCHDLPTLGGSGVERVVQATRWEDGTCDPLAGEGGDVVQPRVTETLRELGGSGEVVPRGTTHTVDLVAPSLYGAGLLEAIPEALILARADPDDADGDGISGRAGRDARGTLARFGHKATDASLRAFVEGALLQEMGLTTAAHPRDLDINGSRPPEGADPAPDPEVAETDLEDLLEYVRHLAPPAPALPGSGEDSLSVALGTRLFTEIGCAACHVPSMTTSSPVRPSLDGRTVHLYSDLLLHDLGSEVEGVCGPSASPTELRTAPLMGLRHRPFLMHDAGASNLEAVVVRHGGEAAASRDRFRGLSADARQALLRFLGTL